MLAMTDRHNLGLYMEVHCPLCYEQDGVDVPGNQCTLPRVHGMYVCRLLHIGRIRMDIEPGYLN
jgi:hypothetical protein